MTEPKRYIPALNGTAFMGMAESNGIGNTYGPRYCMEDYSSGFVRSADYDALKAENAELQQQVESLQNKWACRPLSNQDLLAENERLRFALREIMAVRFSSRPCSAEDIARAALNP